MQWLFQHFRGNRSSENRRKLGNGKTPWHQRIRTAFGLPLVIATGFWALATLVTILGDEPLTYAVGKELKHTVLSRVDFEREDTFRTNALRREAQQAVPNYFRINQAMIDRVRADSLDLHAAVKASEDYEQYKKAHEKRWSLPEPAFSALKALTDETGSDQFKRNVDTLAARLSEAEMTTHPDVEREIRSTASVVMFDRGDDRFREIPKEKLNYASNNSDVETLANKLVRYVFVEEVRPILQKIIIEAISPGNDKYHPVYVYDSNKTEEMIDEAAANVPVVMDKYEAGDRLVKAGAISDEAFALLKKEHEEYLRQRNHNPELRMQWKKKQGGLMGVVMLVTIGLSIFTYRTQPRIAQKAPRALGIAGLMLGMLIFDRFVLLQVDSSQMWSVTTVAMTAAILTIAYAQLFALGMSIGLCLLTVITLDAPYSLLIVLFSVAAMTVLMLREIRTRMKMVVVGLVTSGAAVISAFLVGLIDGQVARVDVLIAAVAAMAGLSLVLVLLPVIEMVFRITTSQTLLEWADTSRPLLRQLMEKAPGTWQHSQLLGSMAETAAEEIGANGLLVRVGAYYHDIGKTCKPNYFVENQEARMNAHTGLAPTMSLLVILAHVKDGLALAREHRLPPILHQFIAEHHGTTVVKYFHHMATQEAKTTGQREVSDTEFRYPGPKPRSRESAILMLCDGVEGAVRSLQDPTPGRIEHVVHEILMARLMDGQFDDCEITLKELARIEQSLVKSLRAIHHGRITYPKSEEPAEAQVRTA